MSFTDDRAEPPQFAGDELHLHVTGSIAAALVPWWINWLRFTTPHVTVNVSVSRSATRFVSVDAIRHIANGEVWVDAWRGRELPHSWRNGGTGASQCIIVFPATLDTVMRLAQGRADSPALMMMQLTELPIVVADVLPSRNTIIQHWCDVLAERPNVAFAPRVLAPRADDRTLTENGFNLPGALLVANQFLT